MDDLKSKVLMIQEQQMKEIEDSTKEASLDDLRKNGISEDGKGDEEQCK